MLSPRLEEFLTIKQSQISKIFADSDQRKNQISEYPDWKQTRLNEKSFENIVSQMKGPVYLKKEISQERSISSLMSSNSQKNVEK